MTNRSIENTFKILIVDDSKDTRQFLRLIISNKFNCEVLEAVNGKEALDIAFSENPGLIILDIMMPIMDGYEFLKLLRADKRGANIPVIICSAIGEKSTVTSFVEEGITDYILKPINFTLVFSKIDKIIKKSLSKFMEFSLDSEGIGCYVSEPFPTDFYIKLKNIEGSSTDDIYTLKIGNENTKTTAKISDNSVLKIPAHNEPLKLTFQFAYTRNKIITIFFDLLD